jgi:hypothetical protein
MLPPPTRTRTTTPRVIAALLFALILPSVCVSQLLVWTGTPGDPTDRTAMALAAVIISPLFGAMAGWPYLLTAYCVWATLDQFDRHYPWMAAVVGLATGLAVGLRLTGAEWNRGDITIPVCTSIGVVTGLGVWWIAYGRQDRLPRPIVTRPRLNLDA